MGQRGPIWAITANCRSAMFQQCRSCQVTRHCSLRSKHAPVIHKQTQPATGQKTATTTRFANVRRSRAADRLSHDHAAMLPPTQMAASGKQQSKERMPTNFGNWPSVLEGINVQISMASAITKASSSATPRYLTVLSIFVCPRRS